MSEVRLERGLTTRQLVSLMRGLRSKLAPIYKKRGWSTQRLECDVMRVCECCMGSARTTELRGADGGWDRRQLTLVARRVWGHKKGVFNHFVWLMDFIGQTKMIEEKEIKRERGKVVAPGVESEAVEKRQLRLEFWEE